MSDLILKLNTFETDAKKIDEAADSNNKLVVDIMGSPGVAMDDVQGSCLEFDGVDDYLDLNYKDTNRAGTDILKIEGNQTIRMWLDPDTSGDQPMRIYTNPATKEAVRLESDGSLTYIYTDAENKTDTFSTQNPVYDVLRVKRGWVHIVLVREISVETSAQGEESETQTLRWYVSGQQSDQTSRDYDPALSGSGAFTIARGTEGDVGYSGKILLYSPIGIAMTEEEVQEFSGQPPGDSPGSFLEFKGDQEDISISGEHKSMDILQTEGSQTTEMWIDPEPPGEKRMRIYTNTTTGESISLGTDGKLTYTYTANNGTTTDFHTQDAVYDAGTPRKWIHLAVVRDIPAEASQEVQEGQKAAQPMLYWYVDGKPAGTANAAADPYNASDGTNTEITIAKGEDTTNGDAYFKGKIALFKIADRPKPPEELNRSIKADVVALAAFKVEYPLEFSLHHIANTTEEPNRFYISDGENNRFRLGIENTSDAKIRIRPFQHEAASSGSGNDSTTHDENTPESVPASKAHHHFELRFKPKMFEAGAAVEASGENTEGGNNWQYLRGTGDYRKKAADGKMVPMPGWKVSPAERHDDGKVSVYLLYTGKDTDSKDTDSNALKDEEYEEFDPGWELAFDFEYKSADGSGGARSTQVMLLYRDIWYDEDEEESIDGSRLQHADIINRRGKEQIPLHVGVVGSNSILNDATPEIPESGTANTIIIRIANTLPVVDGEPEKNRIRFNTGNVDTERNTQFTLLFDDPVDDDWDLAEKDQLNAINVDFKQRYFEIENGTYQLDTDQSFVKSDTSETSAEKNEQGEINIFGITPQRNYLGPQEYIEITLSGIRTAKASGISYIYIKYEDVKGYWDGQFAIPVEKTPVVSREVSGAKNVGIGITPDAQNRLKVNGDLSVVEGNMGIGLDTPQNKLDVAGGVVIGASYSESGTAPNNGLLVEGNVGIGATDPQNKLDVEGGTVIGATYAGFNTAPDNGLLVEGNVGIGRTTTRATLDVQGRIYDITGHVMPAGGIIMWFGDHNGNIPIGWALCNGQNGTPDLRDKFIVGAGSQYNWKAEGGADRVTLTVEQMPSHSHSGTTDSNGIHNHEVGKRGVGDGEDLDALDGSKDDDNITTEDAGAHTHTFTTNSTGGSKSHENRPPYYALCFIMKL